MLQKILLTILRYPKRIISGLRKYHFNNKSIKGAQAFEGNNYEEWIRLYDTVTTITHVEISKRMEAMSCRPLISIIILLNGAKSKWLFELIGSIRCQIYQNWQLHIIKNEIHEQNVLSRLEQLAAEDGRINIEYPQKNRQMWERLNDAIKSISGKWVIFLTPDVQITEYALFYVANTISRHPNVQLIYSDEDKLDEDGKRSDPYFKCAWNRTLFYSQNYIRPFAVYYKNALLEAGGFQRDFWKAWDYDLSLRVIERLTSDEIYHIPRILCHIKTCKNDMGKSITSSNVRGEEQMALSESLRRQNVNAAVDFVEPGYRVHYTLPEPKPLVSIVILTKNQLLLIEKCVRSLLEKTGYKNYELLIVDNGSDEPKVLEYLNYLRTNPVVRVTQNDSPFNFSALNNKAVEQANGEYICLLNNDVVVINSGWLSEMLSIAAQPDVGVVGASLWYPDDTLQHGGVILGYGGNAGHSHKHYPKGDYGYFGRMALMSEFSAVTGACMMVRKSIYEKLGGLNERDLPVAYNDIDFCLRVRAEGYRNIWTPYAELYHYESASRGYENTPEKRSRLSNESKYFQQQWGKILLNDPAYSPNLTLKKEDFSFAWPPRVEDQN